jgi:transposase InsO family protein
VNHVQKKLGVSQRRACRVIGQPRASQRYQSVRPDRDAALAKRIGSLAAGHPRFGYRRIWAVLRCDEPAVNLKRVHRLWREAGLQVRRKAS